MPRDEVSSFSTPTPLAGSSRLLRSTATKRDLLTADLDGETPLASAKRLNRSQTQVFKTSLSHSSLERQLVSEKSVRGELEHRLQDREHTIERLERDRRWLADREAELKEQIERESAQWAEEKLKANSELRTLRANYIALQEAHTELEDTHGTLARSTAAQKNQIARLTHRTTMLEEELTHLQIRMSEREAALADAQAELAEASAALLAHSNSGSARRHSALGVAEEDRDEQLIAAELQRQTSYIRTLESKNTRLEGEVARLQARGGSIAVLQEEKRGLEGKVKAMEGLRARVAELESVLTQRSPTTRPSTPSTPTSSVKQTHALATLRLAHAKLLEDNGTLKAELAAAHSERQAVEAEHAGCAGRQEVLEKEKRLMEDRVRRALDAQEQAEGSAKFFKALAENHQAESQHSLEPADDGREELHAKHIAHLEATIDKYKAANAQLEAELNAAGAQKGQQRADPEELERQKQKIAEAEEALRLATAESETHLARIDALEQELFELQGEVAGGRHVPPGVRVLQLRDNPESQWAQMRQAALDRLRGENEALMRRLKEVEARAAIAPAAESAPAPANGECESELVPRESWELLSKEKTELEELLKQKEKRLLRLKEVYNAKGAEFRDAIASILGVKLVFKPNGQVRVTSIYDLCASFVFQPGQQQQRGPVGGGTMQLVAQGEGGPQDLPDLMQFWIAKEQCIPGFMASVTLECYENAKRGGDGDQDS
ncbi:hypothetical protein H0H81_010046 [Sphagnurus paluster]|uniref:Spindle assembly checkpoint component MAD1 n=1 Tax=Sphagnurus paluster TaxID=117069 RepID=A0A9P7K2P5_9AGAR|nr:hypothetical protein H0H81_010046 [Sphagnurus paluster]